MPDVRSASGYGLHDADGEGAFGSQRARVEALEQRVMRALSHPLVLIAWSAAAMIVYALFPSSDTNALIALFVWGAGASFWMAVCERA